MNDFLEFTCALVGTVPVEGSCSPGNKLSCAGRCWVPTEWVWPQEGRQGELLGPFSSTLTSMLHPSQQEASSAALRCSGTFVCISFMVLHTLCLEFYSFLHVYILLLNCKPLQSGSHAALTFYHWTEHAAL